MVVTPPWTAEQPVIYLGTSLAPLPAAAALINSGEGNAVREKRAALTGCRRDRETLFTMQTRTRNRGFAARQIQRRTGLEPEDCLAVAKLLAPRKPAEALDWIERECALDRQNRVSSLHFRKSGFMNGFQALAAGAKRIQQPSFLERAKAHWSERQRNHS